MAFVYFANKMSINYYFKGTNRQEREGWGLIPLTGLTLPHFCARTLISKAICHGNVFCVRWFEVIVRFVDIS